MLFPFHVFAGRCPFCMSSKPGKYGMEIWAASDVCSSYAWNMQVHTGKPAVVAPERKQGMCVVLELSERLRVHKVRCSWMWKYTRKITQEEMQTCSVKNYCKPKTIQTCKVSSIALNADLFVIIHFYVLFIYV